MATKIFYFSATGNCLFVARKIADELSNTTVISIPQVINTDIDTSGEMIGFVFPIYAWGLPNIVEDFIKKIKLNKDQYIFAVGTCGGTPCGTLLQLKKMLQKKGADLNASFLVKENSYTPLSNDVPLIRFMMNIAGKQPLSFKERFPQIIEIIKNNQKHKAERSKPLANFLGTLLHGAAIKSFKTMDNNFIVNEKCNQCQTCEKICPQQNIKIIDGKPKWQNNCEFCFSCLQWCPKNAIQYKGSSPDAKQSHHPEAKLKDFILR